MITCPNCQYENPEGASQCEACYTPLPMTTECPNCGATIQTDATFCGQCGFSLKPNMPSTVETPAGEVLVATLVNQATANLTANSTPDNETPAVSQVSQPLEVSQEISTPAIIPTIVEPEVAPAAPVVMTTQLQQQSAKLLHIRTNTIIELPTNLSVIHMGKPNERIPPDIDVSGFPDSEIVSRSHADIRVEGDAHYLEDVGSSNGTYINNVPLPRGNRHRLRPGDRISLGKGDLVSFLFQIS